MFLGYNGVEEEGKEPFIDLKKRTDERCKGNDRAKAERQRSRYQHLREPLDLLIRIPW